jgi:hypothetical protein
MTTYARTRRRVYRVGTPENEAAWQRMLVDFAHDLGWRVHYVTDSRRSPEGWCDLYLARCKDGRRLVIECKMPGRHETQEQANWLATHNKTGTLAVVAYPADWDWLVELLR